MSCIKRRLNRGVDTPFELLTALHAVRAVKRSSDILGFAPSANLSHVNFLSDGTLEMVMVKRTSSDEAEIRAIARFWLMTDSAKHFTIAQ